MVPSLMLAATGTRLLAAALFWHGLDAPEHPPVIRLLDTTLTGGSPGDQVWALFGLEPTWEYVGDFSGTLLVRPPFISVLFVGIVPPSGELDLVAPAPAVGPGFDVVHAMIQPLPDDSTPRDHGHWQRQSTHAPRNVTLLHDACLVSQGPHDRGPGCPARRARGLDDRRLARREP
jgi:hypothetical protein